MKKRLNIIISSLLLVSLCISVFSVRAFSYANNVPVSSDCVILVNADTATVVYNKNADARAQGGYLSALMTFVVVCENLADYETRSVEIERGFVEEIPSSDGSLNAYIGKTLTVKDLLTLMMMTPGNDAAYVLASLVSDSPDSFVQLMNQKAASLSMNDTRYTSVSIDPEGEDYTTCRDLYKLYTYALTLKSFKEYASYAEYVPDGYDEEKDKVTTGISIKNPASPYYFRYTATAKDSLDTRSGMALAATTVYHGSTYIFVAMGGKSEAEENVYVDAKKLTTWAYLNLSDKKVADTSEVSAEVGVDSLWRTKKIPLSTGESSYRTVPNEYDSAKFEVTYEIPESIKLPVIKGQQVGAAKITYEGEPLDEIPMTADQSAGINMLSDIGSFISTAYHAAYQDETQAPSEKPTEAVTEQPPVETQPEQEQPEEE